MIKFKNKITNEIITHLNFVYFVWEEAERQYEECFNLVWCNLTKDEQLVLYTEQFENQLNSDWEMVLSR